MIPDPVIEQHSGVFVVRDDLIAGGTKRRILPPLLTGADEFIYASPAASGQILPCVYLVQVRER